VASAKHDGGSARLGSWPLLDQQKLATDVIDAGFVEADHDLEREHQLPVQVPMQRVPVARAMAKQGRRRFRLAGVLHLVQNRQPG
jgi:hypothetical protein